MRWSQRGDTRRCRRSSVAEHLHGKEGVVGSIPTVGFGPPFDRYASAADDEQREEGLCPTLCVGGGKRPRKKEKSKEKNRKVCLFMRAGGRAVKCTRL